MFSYMPPKSGHDFAPRIWTHSFSNMGAISRPDSSRIPSDFKLARKNLCADPWPESGREIAPIIWPGKRVAQILGVHSRPESGRESVPRFWAIIRIQGVAWGEMNLHSGFHCLSCVAARFQAESPAAPRPPPSPPTHLPTHWAPTLCCIFLRRRAGRDVDHRSVG